MIGYPKHYIVFDTETDTSYGEAEKCTMTLRLKMGVAKHVDLRGDKPKVCYCYFDAVEQFHRWVLQHSDPAEHMWLFAHNAGFDIRIIDFFGYLTRGWYSFWSPKQLAKGPPYRDPFVVLENPPMMIQCYTREGASMMWCDTYQWIAHKLATVGEILGYAKLPMPKHHEHIDTWFTYCQRDVDVLDMALTRIWEWLKKDGCDKFMPTRAGQARYIYKKQYEHKSIVYHDNTDASTLERAAYYGGRTDLWRVGEVEGPVHQLDVNSLYPYVMKKNWFPCELLSHEDHGRKPIVLSASQAKSSTAEVWIDDPNNSYPVRCKEGTLFLAGKVHTVLSGPELLVAVSRGVVEAYGRVNRYRMQMLFDKFIDYYWKLRCEAKASGDKVQDTIVKLLMNSLYGKFGQLTSDWEYHDSGMPPDTYGIFIGPGVDDTKVTKSRVLGGNVFNEVQRHESKGSFIAIAAFTTAHARVYMEFLKSIIVDGAYYYQATDSLYCDDAAKGELVAKGLVNGQVLGLLKDEGSHERMLFKNIHHINKGDKEVRGSVRDNSPRIGNDTFVVDIWESFKRAVFDGNTDKVLIKKILKHMPGNYIRQEVLPSGETRPWVIDNWGESLEDTAKSTFVKYRSRVV